ncbi:MAG: hypothetical protein KDK33_03140 [Leptospiraceae bacterium]|nr:hypothetical protein [Leptospiraceae bacterium]
MRTDVAIVSLLFLFSTVFLILCPVYYGSDADYAVPQLVSLLESGDLNLDEYSHLAGKNYQIIRVGERYYAAYPYGTVLLTFPFALLADSLYGSNYLSLHRDEFSIVFASLLMALATCFIYAMGRYRLVRWKSLLLAIFFLVCTSVLSTGSRSLWQQSGSIFLSSVLLWLLEKDRLEQKKILAVLIGLVLGWAFAVRPLTALVTIAVCVYYASYQHMRHRILYIIIPGMLVGVVIALINLQLYGTVLHPYYQWPSQKPVDVLYSLASNLFSPARGFFYWHPAFVLSLAAMIASLRKGADYKFLPFALCIAIAHVWIVCNYEAWWGGHSIGPRLTSDLVPFFVFALIPFLHRMNLRRRPAAGMALIALMFISFPLHFRAAIDPSVGRWNLGAPDVGPGPIWEFRDQQGLAGDRNVRALLMLGPAEQDEPN